MPVASKNYANFQQKNHTRHELWKIANFNTMKSLRISPARVECDFLLQIGTIRAKGNNKNVPNVQVCNPTPALPRTRSIKVFSHSSDSSTLLIGWVNF